MSYQVLARKWRPRSFAEMVGQEHVLTALVNAFENDRLHHAYLLTGTRGVGKTTLARIMARCLNCDVGISAEPCGECNSCVAIDGGRMVDLIEVDAASRTKVEDTRELLENVQYAPTAARFKIYLIDEVHMLSVSSFNALLKTLEEPPPHVKFLLATTDPQKLPATVLSRCLQFNLKNMTPERIVGHLSKVLGEEAVGFDEPALWELGRAARGSMRDALSLTDQAIAFGGGTLGLESVREMLGSINMEVVTSLLGQVAAGDAAGTLQQVSDLVGKGLDCEAVLDGLLESLHHIAVLQHVPDAGDSRGSDREILREFAASIAAEDVQYLYQMMMAGKRDFSVVGDSRAALEMLLLRALAFRPAGVPVDGSKLAAVAGNTGDPNPVKKPRAVSEPLAAEAPTSVVNDDAADGKLVAEPVPAPELATPSAPVSVKKPTVPSDNSAAMDVWRPASSTWAADFYRLKLPGLTGAIAAQCELQEVAGDRLRFVMDEECSGLYDPEQCQKLEKLLSERSGRTLALSLTPGPLTTPSPARWLQLQKQRKTRDNMALLHNDPVLAKLLAAFDAELDETSLEYPESSLYETRH